MRRGRTGRVPERETGREKGGFMVVVVMVFRERGCWLRGAAGKGEKNKKDGRLDDELMNKYRYVICV